MADLRDRYPEVYVSAEQNDDVRDLARVQRFPALFAAFLALLAAVSIGHGMVLVTRRRRRDLAIVRALGFTPRQAFATLIWSGTTIAVLSLLLGIPIGIVAGGRAWAPIADHVRAVLETVVPVWLVAVIAVACVFMAGVVSLVPARRAARLAPAGELRAE